MVSVLKKNALALIALAALLVFPFLFPSPYIIGIAIVTVMYAALSTSWNFVSGFAGQFGLGNGLYFALGAYITAMCFQGLHMSPWLGMLVAAVIVAVIAFIFGYLTFPLSGSYYALATVALLSILRIFFSQVTSIFGIRTGGVSGIRMRWEGGFSYMQFMDIRWNFYMIVIMLVILILITKYISQSKAGFYFRAINTNQMAAGSLGVNIIMYKQLAQLLTAVSMAIIGGFFAMYLTFIEPIGMFSFTIAFNISLMAVVGGRATVYGPAIGAFILMPLFEFLRRWAADLPGLPTALFGLVLMLSMQFMPMGLVPLINEKIQKYRAKRQKSLSQKAILLEGGTKDE
jgi:branched-chain amino acid transport system permease protein